MAGRRRRERHRERRARVRPQVHELRRSDGEARDRRARARGPSAGSSASCPRCARRTCASRWRRARPATARAPIPRRAGGRASVRDPDRARAAPRRVRVAVSTPSDTVTVALTMSSGPAVANAWLTTGPSAVPPSLNVHENVSSSRSGSLLPEASKVTGSARTATSVPLASVATGGPIRHVGGAEPNAIDVARALAAAGLDALDREAEAVAGRARQAKRGLRQRRANAGLDVVRHDGVEGAGHVLAVQLGPEGGRVGRRAVLRRSEHRPPRSRADARRPPCETRARRPA